MKNWLKKLVSLGILLTGMALSAQTLAVESINWNQASVLYTYDYYTKALKVQVFAPYENTPGYQYQADLVINGKSYSQTFAKYSVTNKLYVEQMVPIGITDLAPNYTLDLNVTNKNTGATAYHRTFTQTVDNYVNWNGVVVSASYNTLSQYLEVRATLDNVNASPSSVQYSTISIAGKTNSTTFNYSSADKQFVAIHKIYIALGDVSQTYSYLWQAKDSSQNILLSKSGTIQTGVGSNYQGTDTLNWSLLTVQKNYDSSSQNLTLTYVLPNISSIPRDSYSLGVTVNGKTYRQTLLYSGEYDQMYATYGIGMTPSEYQSVSTISYDVYNESQKATAYSTNGGTNQCNNNCSNPCANTCVNPCNTNCNGGTSTLPNWNNLSITNSYASSAQQLSIFFNINQVTLVNGESYIIRINFNGSTYTKTFEYNSQARTLQTTITTSISPAYLQNNYTVTYSITKNVETTPLYNGSKNFTLNNNTTTSVQTPTFSWNNAYVDNSYDTQAKILNISIGWDGVTSAPSMPYTLKISLNNKYYIEDLYYSSTYKKLFAQFQVPIASSDLSSHYTISYWIINESTGNAIWSKGNVIINTKSDGSTTSSTAQGSQAYDVSEATLSNATNRYIQALEKKYTTNTARITQIEKVIKLLKLYSLKHAKYATICNRFIEKFESQLNVYENLDSKVEESDDILDFLIESSHK